MLVDEAEVIFRAGHGGAGKVAFFPGLKSGPAGGNGGKGGDVYLQATSDLTALRPFTFTKLIAAENGWSGEGNRKFGKDGKDVLILIPMGSVLKDKRSGEEINITKPDEKILICKGGIGGKGNYEFKSSRNTTPRFSQPGLPGEEKHFEIILKLTADYGLIGLPNAGKSSLLNELTAASVKTANYPFTTLEPNLGVLNNKVLADIPGLIEGAAIGKGLGIKFLKHIEKTAKLLHCISADSEDVKRGYEVVMNELKSFNKDLIEKEQIILLTKSDLVTMDDLSKKVAILQKYQHKVLIVSIYDLDSLENLKKVLTSVSSSA